MGSTTDESKRSTENTADVEASSTVPKIEDDRSNLNTEDKESSTSELSESDEEHDIADLKSDGEEEEEIEKDERDINSLKSDEEKKDDCKIEESADQSTDQLKIQKIEPEAIAGIEVGSEMDYDDDFKNEKTDMNDDESGISESVQKIKVSVQSAKNTNSQVLDVLQPESMMEEGELENSQEDMSESSQKSREASPKRQSTVHHVFQEPALPRERGPSKRCLGVFGLATTTTQADLLQHFSKYGAIDHVTLIVDPMTCISRGFGFIYFKNNQDAAFAKEKTDGGRLQKRQIRVDFSTTHGPKPRTPGVYKGPHKWGGAKTEQKEDLPVIPDYFHNEKTKSVPYRPENESDYEESSDSESSSSSDSETSSSSSSESDEDTVDTSIRLEAQVVKSKKKRGSNDAQSVSTYDNTMTNTYDQTAQDDSDEYEAVPASYVDSDGEMTYDNTSIRDSRNVVKNKKKKKEKKAKKGKKDKRRDQRKYEEAYQEEERRSRSKHSDRDYRSHQDDEKYRYSRYARDYGRDYDEMSESKRSYSTLRASRSPDSEATRSERSRRYRSRSPIDKRYRRNYKSSSRDEYSKRDRSRSDRSYGDTRSRDRYYREERNRSRTDKSGKSEEALMYIRN